MDKQYTYKITGYSHWNSTKPQALSLLAATPGVLLHTIKSNAYSEVFFKFKGTKPDLTMLIALLAKQDVSIRKIKKVWF